MGLTNLRTKFRDSSKHTWWGILLVLGLAIMLPVFFSGAPTRNRRNVEEERRQGAIAEQDQVIATVGKDTITRGKFDEYLTQRLSAMSQGQTVTPIMMHMYAPTLLPMLEDQLILVQSAKKEGIQVSASDLDAEIKKRVDAQAKQTGVYDLVPEQQGPMLDQIKANMDAQRDDIRNELIVKGLEDKLEKNVSLTTPGLKPEDVEINARHILIQWKGLPSADKKKVTRTQAEAKALATKLTAEAQANPSGFAVLAQNNSDEPGAKQRGGDLGWFGKTAMVKPFWDACYAAKTGSIIGPVASAFGYHVIKIEDKRVSQARQYQEVQKFLDAQKKTIKPVVVALDIKAAQADMDARAVMAGKDKKAAQAKRAEVIALYEAAAKERKNDVALQMMLGVLYRDAGSTDKAIAAFQRATALQPDAEVHLALADLYRKTNQKQQAVDQYTMAGRLAGNKVEIHRVMLTAFQEMGEKDLAKQQALWIQRATKNQPQQPPMRVGG